MRRESARAVSRRDFLFGAGAVGSIALAGCTEEIPGEERGRRGAGGARTGGQSLSGQISIAGSSTVYPLSTAVAEEFMAEYPGVDVSIQSTGSGGGFQDFFCAGKTAFNNASRPIQESEEDLCADNDVDWIELEVATDALTVIVNNDNDWVDCVTMDQLEQIWGPGAAETWADVDDDWPDEEIERYGAADTSGTFDYFSEQVAGEAGVHTDDYQPTEKDNVVVQGVQGSEYAIGYFGFSYYYNNPDEVTALAVDDGEGCVEPSLENAREGEYTPLSRPLYTYASKSALEEDHVAAFARYLVERSADESLVADTVGYVPNTQDSVDEQLARLDQAT